MRSTCQKEVQAQPDFTRKETVSAEGTLIKAHTQCQGLFSFGLLINLGATLLENQHLRQLGSVCERAGCEACSLVEFLVRAVSVVNQQLAWGELTSIGSLVLSEPVHHLLSTKQIHEAEGP